MLKKILLPILALMIFTGCTSNIEDENSDVFENIAQTNIIQDYAAYTEIINLYDTNYSNATLDEERLASNIKLYDDIYQLAVNRVNSDLEYIYLFDDYPDYQTYVAYLQAYAEEYLVSQSDLLNNPAKYQLAESFDENSSLLKQLFQIQQLMKTVANSQIK